MTIEITHSTIPATVSTGTPSTSGAGATVSIAASSQSDELTVRPAHC